MMLSAPNPSTAKNRILASIGQQDFDQFFSDLHPISLSLRQILQVTGSPLEYVYFVEKGMTSVLTNMLSGSTIEVGMIGMEGVVGVSALLGAETAAQHVIVQIPGTALRMTAARCKDAFNHSADIRRVINRFVNGIINQSSQTAACNRLHSIEQRCARWLLMASDRIQSLTMPMTHEFLSAMLGVRRAGVSEIAAELQRSGLIRYHRGQLTIIDRESLKATVCECYKLDHARFNTLFEGN